MLADRIAGLRDGRLLEVGPAEDVYSAPASPFAANFLGEMNFFEAVATPDGAGLRLVAGGTNLVALPQKGLTGRGLAGGRAEGRGGAPPGRRGGGGGRGGARAGP